MTNKFTHLRMKCKFRWTKIAKRKNIRKTLNSWYQRVSKAGYTLCVFHIRRYFRRLFAKNKMKRESARITVHTLHMPCYFHISMLRFAEFLWFFLWGLLHMRIFWDMWKAKCDTQKTCKNSSICVLLWEKGPGCRYGVTVSVITCKKFEVKWDFSEVSSSKT